MNNTPLKNIGRLTAFQLKNNKKAVIGWSIAVFAIMFMYMGLFESVKDMAQVKMDAMPKEMLSFVGMEEFSDMGNYVTYFGMIFNMLMIAVSIFAATFSANTIYREEKRKTIEFLNSLNVSRTEIYISKLICSFIALTVVAAMTAIPAIICGYAVGGETFSFVDCAAIIKISGFTPYVFLAFSIMTAGAVSSVNAPMAGSMAVLACYFIGYMGKLLEDKAQWLTYLSPFEMFSPQNAVAMESETLTAFGIYLAVCVLFIITGAVVYKRRDFKM